MCGKVYKNKIIKKGENLVVANIKIYKLLGKNKLQKNSKNNSKFFRVFF